MHETRKTKRHQAGRRRGTMTGLTPTQESLTESETACDGRNNVVIGRFGTRQK